MITTKTTLILGAGTSQPYGLPLGPALMARARELQPSDQLYQILIAVKHRENRISQLNEFAARIREYPGPSIDAFLEDWPKFKDLGHEVIAALMGQAAASAKQQRQNGAGIKESEDWIRHLIQVMRAGAGTPERFCTGNQVKFITFNFDTVLDEALVAALHGLYEPQPWNASPPEIIHVHGVLPDMVKLEPEWISSAAKSVRVIQDELDQAIVLRAREAITWAEVVCFLGFGFHRENIATLQLPFRLKDKKPDDVFGTALSLYDGQRANIHRACEKRLILGEPDCGSKQLLLRYDVLRG